MDLQTVVSRELNPDDFGVLTVGLIHSGSRHNIIADSATIEGTIRIYNKEARETLIEGFERIIENVGRAYRVETEVTYNSSAAAVYSTDKILDFLLDTTLPKIDVEVVEIPRFTGSEDFSYFLEEIPGAYLIVGTNGGEETSYANHHPLFDIFIYYHQLYAKAFNLDII